MRGKIRNTGMKAMLGQSPRSLKAGFIAAVLSCDDTRLTNPPSNHKSSKPLIDQT